MRTEVPYQHVIQVEGASIGQVTVRGQEAIYTYFMYIYVYVYKLQEYIAEPVTSFRPPSDYNFFLNCAGLTPPFGKCSPFEIGPSFKMAIPPPPPDLHTVWNKGQVS